MAEETTVKTVFAARDAYLALTQKSPADERSKTQAALIKAVDDARAEGYLVETSNSDWTTLRVSETARSIAHRNASQAQTETPPAGQPSASEPAPAAEVAPEPQSHEAPDHETF